ncbi:nucleotidyltransferase domain protein [bacterium BMS3Abin07]|nr:nucleotidyltransferase domain protein [bacterium BMS3Abin07]GBE33146.1 nucleotidyltransferase domain protein [bacterium BMS3Bbin05]HDL20405.1 nucleotidyltransferase domain-containing protein [Nitrospirota bacterium]HDO22630.1 nucleotidyltransferase domain-containing protein [Nitrospirota bacterium]HDZ87063.1 nucleotidyltransferase domain-containing protein [Nitrospirota bacterium]
MIRYKRLPEDIKERLACIEDYLGQHPQVIFAYLFGGLAREDHSPLSDVDMALYVKDPKRFGYLTDYTKITNLLGTDELDLVILNRAPLSLAGRILLSRKVLVDKDPFLRHRYESLTLRKFFDFRIKERAIFTRRYGIG